MSEVTSPNRIFVRRLYRNLEKEPYKMLWYISSIFLIISATWLAKK